MVTGDKGNAFVFLECIIRGYLQTEERKKFWSYRDFLMNARRYAECRESATRFASNNMNGDIMFQIRAFRNNKIGGHRKIDLKRTTFLNIHGKENDK